MNLKRYRVAMLVIVAAVAMLLSGCGGDDNGGLSAEDMARIDSAEADAATARAEAMAAAAAQAEAEAEATAAAAAQAAAEAEAATAMAAQLAAEAEAATAKAAQTEAEGDAADAAIAQAAAEAAQAAAEAAQVAAENAQATAEAATETANAMIAMLQQEIDDLEAAAAAGPDTAGTLEGAASRAAAARIMASAATVTRTVAEAATRDATDIVDPTAVGTVPNPPTDDFPYSGGTDAAGTVTWTLEHMAANATPDNHAEPGATISRAVSVADLAQARLGQPAELSLAVEGGTGLNTADDSADTDAPAIAGWDGVALEKDGPGAITQMALVYSDAERSVRAFGDVYPANVGVDGGTSVTPTHRGIIQTLPVATDPDLVANLDPRISFTHGLSVGVPSREIATDGAVGGSYDGVPGVYIFRSAGDSTLALTPNGLTIAGGGANSVTGGADLIFIADNPEALLPDTDYLAFGVWTEVPDSPTLANAGRVQGFVHGSANVYKWRHVAALDGTASYSGAAVGHYATRAQGAYTAEMGRFTADAALTANFGADADPYDPGNDGMGLSVTGTIDGFMDEDGTAMAGWVVNLLDGSMLTRTFDNATAVSIHPRPSTDGDIYGATSGTTGSLSWSGVWDAWLFGGNTATYPTGVAGRFQAAGGSAQPMTTTGTGAIDLFADEGFAGVTGSFAGR